MELFERVITNGLLIVLTGGDFPSLTEVFEPELKAAFEDLRSYIQKEIEKGVRRGIEEYMQSLPPGPVIPEAVVETGMISATRNEAPCSIEDVMGPLQRRLARKRQEMA